MPDEQKHHREQFLDPRILQLFKKMEEDGGILLKEIGDNIQLIEVHTQNSIYKIVPLRDPADARCIVIQGNNRYFPTPVKALLVGSTWTGSSMIRLGWLGIGMLIEIWLKKAKPCFTSSLVSTIRLREGKQYKAEAERMRQEAGLV